MPTVWTCARWTAVAGGALTLAGGRAAAQATQATQAVPDARQSLITVAVSPETVTVGERFTIRVRVRAPKVATIRFPDVPAAAGGIDPVDPRAIEDGPASSVLDRTAAYTFVAWELGRRAPALGPVVVAVAGRERTFPLGNPAVEVRSLLPTDSALHTPREARAPVRLPGSWWRYVFLGALLAAGAAWYWWRRRQRLVAERAGAGRVPDPWQQAQAKFTELENLGLDEAGEPGRHVIAHVDVLRAYVERRFPSVHGALDGAGAAAVLATTTPAAPVDRVAALFQRDAELRFAHDPIGREESVLLASEARDIARLIQIAHEAQLRAVERPPRPRRR